MYVDTGGVKDDELSSPDLTPRRLRYSEEVLPLHFFAANENAPVATTAAPSGVRSLKVFARIKPSGAQSTNVGGTSIHDAQPGGDGASGACLQATATEVVQRARDGGVTTYSFDRVFERSDQEHFFQTAVEPLVDELVSLRTASSVFMAYGASGTGKSFTMQGTAAHPGVIPRTLDRLYQLLRERGLGHQVQLSFYEVHDNKVYDLLQAVCTGKPPSQHLPITQLGLGCCMPGLLRCHCESAEAGRRLYTAAVRIRKQAPTLVNNDSSRSHAVFTVQVIEAEKGIVKGRSATLSLADLAGAERAAQTKHAGSKLRESAGINTSLLVLGRCIKALQHNQALAQRAAAAAAARAAGGAAVAAAGGGGGPAGSTVPWVIPVRESSLTTLFRGVLTGQGNLVLSVHVSPHPGDQRMTAATLGFAALAAQVQMAVTAPVAAAAAHVAAGPPAQPQQQRSGQTGKNDASYGLRRPGTSRMEPAIPECPEEEEEEEVQADEDGEEQQEEEGAEEEGDPQQDLRQGVDPGPHAEDNAAARPPGSEEQVKCRERGAADAGAATEAAGDDNAGQRQAGSPAPCGDEPAGMAGGDVQGAPASTQQLAHSAAVPAPERERDGAARNEVSELVGALRSQVQQLQQQLVCAEEQARTAAASEWEALLVESREELEEAQGRAARLERQLAVCQRQLAAERAANKALNEKLQAALCTASQRPVSHRAPGRPPKHQGPPVRAAAHYPPSGRDFSGCGGGVAGAEQGGGAADREPLSQIPDKGAGAGKRRAAEAERPGKRHCASGSSGGTDHMEAQRAEENLAEAGGGSAGIGGACARRKGGGGGVVGAAERQQPAVAEDEGAEEGGAVTGERRGAEVFMTGGTGATPVAGRTRRKRLAAAR